METPSLTIYSEMQHAFSHLNRTLFGGKLPEVVLSLQRKANVRGYYSPSRYRKKGAEEGDLLALALGEEDDFSLDEIALNPDMLLHRSDKESLSTLAHEQVHQWVEQFTSGARRGHHCKRWAAKMKEIGLQPSSTGEPGGKETGSSVTHYIIQGGAFDRAAEALLKTGFRFAWGSVAALPKEGKAGKRVKYVCPACGAAVWGKADLNLQCLDCDEMYVCD